MKLLNKTSKGISKGVKTSNINQYPRTQSVSMNKYFKTQTIRINFVLHILIWKKGRST